MIFYIRADANKQIGTGHVMRCLSIAMELKNRGIETIFLNADHDSDQMIHARGFKTHCLHSLWNDMETELPALLQYIKENNITHILVDSYFVTKRYFESLQCVVQMSYMDDIGLPYGNLYALINYNIYAPKMGYEKRTDLHAQKYLLGPQYVPLREEFQNITPVFHEVVKNVMISTGGTDGYNVAGNILKCVAGKYPDVTFHVISGVMNQNYDCLCQLQQKEDNIRLYSNVLKMSEIMCRCDLAISACGSTIYELCACGVPLITYTLADNQLLGAKELELQKLAVYCGDCRKGMGTMIEAIDMSLAEMINSKEKRYQMQERQLNVINCQGSLILTDQIV